MSKIRIFSSIYTLQMLDHPGKLRSILARSLDPPPPSQENNSWIRPRDNLCVMAAPPTSLRGVVIILDLVIPGLHRAVDQFFVFLRVRVESQVLSPSFLFVFELTSLNPASGLFAQLIIPNLQWQHHSSKK